jgi:hypothetical protein
VKLNISDVNTSGEKRRRRVIIYTTDNYLSNTECNNFSMYYVVQTVWNATIGGSVRMSRNIVPNHQSTETESPSLHPHATSGAKHLSPTQKACLYFSNDNKASLCVCVSESTPHPPKPDMEAERERSGCADSPGRAGLLLLKKPARLFRCHSP